MGAGVFLYHPPEHRAGLLDGVSHAVTASPVRTGALEDVLEKKDEAKAEGAEAAPENGVAPLA